ncbi:MAG: hypothetical protein HUU15_07205, partial [Candidatus Brocadiae bacterium]|nr:hypothetical protein [Candidatus Brocadiia bacterium]
MRAATMVNTPGETTPDANPLFACAYCESPVRDTMTACPYCRLSLDAGQVVLRRFSILLSECGSWHRSGDVPPAAADRLMGRYRREYDSVLEALGRRSDQFQPHVVPGAVAIAAVTAAPPPVRRTAPVL